MARTKQTKKSKKLVQATVKQKVQKCRPSKAKTVPKHSKQQNIDSIFGSVRKQKGPSHIELPAQQAAPLTKRSSAVRALGAVKKASKLAKEMRKAKRLKNKKSQPSAEHPPPQGRSNSSSRKKQKSNKKVATFQMRLPKGCRENSFAPWLRQGKKTNSTITGDGATASTEADTPIRTNGFSGSKSPSSILALIQKIPGALEQFDWEMECFARYVQLSTEECQARNYVIDSVQQIVTDFIRDKKGLQDDRTHHGTATRCTNGPDQSNETFQGVRCKVFGSYASQQVCTFQSDVDLAVWGVVPPDEKKEDLETLDSSDVNDGIAEHKGRASNDHPNRKRQAKVIKWKEALECVDILHRKNKIASSVAEGQSKLSPGNGKTSDTPVGGEANSGRDIFVLDRTSKEPVDVETTGQPKIAEGVKENPIILGGDGDVKLDATGLPLYATLGTGKVAPLVIDLDDDAGAVSCAVRNTDKYDSAGGGQQAVDASDDDTADKLEGLQDGTFAACHRPEESNRITSWRHYSDDRMKRVVESVGNSSSPSPLSLPNQDHTSRRAGGDSQNIEACREGEGDEDGEDVRCGSVVSLSSSTTGRNDDEHSWDDSGMEVSFVTPVPKTPASQGGLVRYYEKPADVPSPVSFGPVGPTRALVISALNSLAKRFRRFFSLDQKLTMTVRKFARVPIINMETPFGYDVDVALGGHNGTDTSSYASSQSRRFQSFSTVVLVLKVLLSQQGLDKPFTGGLGSFKLYVLVAHHLDRHLSLGGSDRPAEILLTFLFRYGGQIRGHKKIELAARTRLSRSMVIEYGDSNNHSSTSLVDLGGVYQVENCVKLFEECWHRLYESLRVNHQRQGQRQSRNPKGHLSYLMNIIETQRLEKDRSACIRKASSWVQHSQSKHPRKNLPSTSRKRSPSSKRGSARPHKKARKSR